MANETIFKGYVLTKQSAFTESSADTQTLYFVRTNSGKTDGYLYFNGKKYGTAEDLKKALINGEDTYVNFKAVGDALRDLDEAIKALEYHKTEGSAGSNTQLTEASNVVEVYIGQTDGCITGHTVGVKTLPLSGNTLITAGSDGYNWTVGAAATGVGLAKSADISTRLKADEEVIAAGLNKLHRDITAETADRRADIESAITSLDATATTNTADGYISVTVKETDGKLVGVTLTDTTASIVTGETDAKHFKLDDTTNKWSARTSTIINGLATAQNVQSAMIEDEVVIADALNTLSGAIKTNEVQIVKIITGLSSGITAAYELHNANGTKLGERIDIYKDQFLKETELKSGAQLKADHEKYPEEETSGLVSNHMYLVFHFVVKGESETEKERRIYLDVHDLADEIQAVSSTTTIEMGKVGSTTGGTGVTIYARVKPTSITNSHIANTTIERTKVANSISSSLTLADTAIQSVNGIGTGTTPLTAITLTAEDIKTSADITGVTEINSGTTIQSALQTLSTNLKSITDNAVTSITSTGNTLSVTGTGNARNLEIHTEATGTSTVNAGHIQIKMNANHEFYGQMYFYGDDVDMNA